MKRLCPAIFLAITLLGLLPSPALVKDVQAQQAQIVANQTKIDSKLADLAETIRMARIFSRRSR